MLNAVAGAELQASVSGFDTDMTGMVGVQILDSLGNVVMTRTPDPVIEAPPGSGTYMATLPAPLSPGGYLVFWDEGTVTPQTSFGEPLVVAPGVALVSDPKLLWLRRMCDDLAVTEADIIQAPGVSTEFFVTSPPIVQMPMVSLAGIPMFSPGDFSWTSYSIIFTVAPPAGQMITVRYSRTTFDDVELESYITAAQEEYIADRHVVYKAAIYAIDTLLTGFASALDFGSGQESFSLSSVFTRLNLLRSTWETWLERNAENGLEVFSMYFDSQDPTFPGSFDPNQLDYGTNTVTGSPPGYPGAFQP
jgi:hypothetical protein